MTDLAKAPIAAESGHWYTITGEPCYEVPTANGKAVRATTLKDARKLNLVPSVTSILKVLAKPGLDQWIQRQVLLASLTLTRNAVETDDDFIARIMADSKETARKAAERGTALHAHIERALTGQEPWSDIVYKVAVRLKDGYGLDVSKTIVCEHSFACGRGYGGKIDLWDTQFVVDFKTKETLTPEQLTGKGLVYDEHAMQLAAYRRGLHIGMPRCLNVFVGVNDSSVAIVEHTAEELEKGWAMFDLALALWQAKNGYVPDFYPNAPTAQSADRLLA